MLLHRIAAGLVFAAGLVVLRAAVGFESWVLLALGLCSAASGFLWFFMVGSPHSHIVASPGSLGHVSRSR